jgi:uncharacterized RDD family membrane protein YckC
MTTSQPRYQDPSLELECSSADPFSEDRPAAAAPPPLLPPDKPPECEQSEQFGQSRQFRQLIPLVPPPQFGRLPYSARSPEAARARTRRLQGGQESSAAPVAPPEPGVLPVPPPIPLADFGARTVSFLIDYVVPVVVLNLLLAIGAVTGGPAWRLMLAVGGYVVLLGFGLWNSGYLQGTTGRSIGRLVANTKLVGIETGQPVGFGRAVARQICHVLEFGIGYLWPLWDGKRQTFADKIVGTVVVHVGGPTKDDVGGPTEDRVGTDHPRLGE